MMAVLDARWNDTPDPEESGARRANERLAGGRWATAPIEISRRFSCIEYTLRYLPVLAFLLLVFAGFV